LVKDSGTISEIYLLELMIVIAIIGLLTLALATVDACNGRPEVR